MGLKTSIKINPTDKKSFDGVINYLKDIDVPVEQVFEAVAKKTVQKMKKDAPVDTGRLRTNITAQREVFGGYEISSEAIDPETGEDYTFEQNFGGRFIRATYYFTKNIKYFNAKVERDLRTIFRTLSPLKRIKR